MRKVMYAALAVGLGLLALAAVIYVTNLEENPLVANTTTEIQLVGEAERDRFVTLKSTVPGRWIVLGPGAVDIQEFTPGFGMAHLNRRDTRVSADRTECITVGPPGSYVAMLAPDDSSLDFLYLPFVITDGDNPVPPGPGPDPGPEPGPDPKPPVGDEVAQASFQAGSKLPAAAKAQAGAIAELYTSVGARWIAGGFPSYSAANSYLKVERAKIWSDQTAAWETWLTPMSEVFRENITADSSREDIIQFWNSLAKGLEAVK